MSTHAELKALTTRLLPVLSAADADPPMAQEEQEPAFFILFDALLSDPTPERRQRFLAFVPRITPKSTPLADALLLHAGGQEHAAIARLRALYSRNPTSSVRGRWLFLLEGRARFQAMKPGHAMPRITQFWDRDPPEDVAARFAEWAALAGPDGHQLFNDESGRALLREVAGADGAAAWDACWHATIKSDLLRAAALLRDGGFYVDADLRPAAETARTLRCLGSAPSFVLRANTAQSPMRSDTLFMPARHPLAERFLRHGLENILRHGIRDPLKAAGPGALMAVFGNALAAGEVDDATAITYSERPRLLARAFHATYKNDARSWQLASGAKAAAPAP